MYKAIYNRYCVTHFDSKLFVRNIRSNTPTKQLLYSHLPPISHTIWVRWTRHWTLVAEVSYELINDVLLSYPTYVRTSIRQPAKTFVYQRSADTGCSLVDDRDRWGGGEILREFGAINMIWWLWWYRLYLWRLGNLLSFLDRCDTRPYQWGISTKT